MLLNCDHHAYLFYTISTLLSSLFSCRCGLSSSWTVRESGEKSGKTTRLHICFSDTAPHSKPPIVQRIKFLCPLSALLREYGKGKANMMRPILLGLVTLVANGASELFNGQVRGGFPDYALLILSGLDPSVEAVAVFFTGSQSLRTIHPPGAYRGHQQLGVVVYTPLFQFKPRDM